jgi:hypothetical protein
MNISIARVALAAGALWASLSNASPQTYQPPVPKELVGKELRFVSCPIMRATDHPCWVTEYEGELYFLGVQAGGVSNFIAPQLNHKVLVEGVVADKPRICGGIVLEPVRTSTMREVDRSCNAVLPAEGHVIVTKERGAGPAPTQPRRRETPDIEYVAEQRTFVVEFDFDMERPWVKNLLKINEAAAFAQAINARRIEVVGYRGRVELTNGEVLEELPFMPKRRAQYVERTLRALGTGSAELIVRFKEEPDGVDPSARRAVISVVP